MNKQFTMRAINEALDMLSCEPSHPDWRYVQILTDAINELEEARKRERELLILLAWESALLTIGQATRALGCDGPIEARRLRSEALDEGKKGAGQAPEGRLWSSS